MKEYHVLNLGAGVQSTAVALLKDGDFDVAIFADTQEEPAAVYSHLRWLIETLKTQVWIRTAGKLGDHLLGHGLTTKAGKPRFASIPAFAGASRQGGNARRQCSREYKSDVITRAIRRELVGLKPRCRIPKTTLIHQYFGISRDEGVRALAIEKRVKEQGKGRFVAHFPLLEMGWTRGDCLRWLREHVPHEVPRSACVFCPYHSDAEWSRIKADPVAWKRTVKIDHALRGDALARRGMREPLYLHPARRPIDEIDFDAQGQFARFTTECEGVCGV